MTEEKELLTILTKVEYDDVLAMLKAKFKEPKLIKRLSLQCDNYDQADIDTRIRITNGKAELMQKVGDWQNIRSGKSREEIKIELKEKGETILSLYKMIRNLVQGINVQNIIMQFENLIWETKDYEIKLTKQFGREPAFHCEVEVFNNNLNPLDIASQLKIPINPPPDSLNFWKNWNENVNLSANELSDKKILELIDKYLK